MAGVYWSHSWRTSMPYGRGVCLGSGVRIYRLKFRFLKCFIQFLRCYNMQQLWLWGVVTLISVLSACSSGGSGGGGDDTDDDDDDTPASFEFSADVVIGQSNFSNRQANRGGTPDANTADIPLGNAEVAGGVLYLPDSGNSRVLGYNAIPAVNDA